MATKHETEAGRMAGAVHDGNPADRLIDEHETAARLGLSVRTLRRWRWARKGLPYVKVGAVAVRYSERDISSFISVGRKNHSDAA